jgi:CTP:molybdopterin cytidylyltransferase MocA
MAAELLSTLVLLSGGASTRLGEPKGLVRVGGRPWIDLQLLAFEACGGKQAIVVLGYDAQRYDSVCIRAQVAVNPRPELGPFSSLACALALVQSDTPGVFVLPIDVPCAEPDTWHALEQALQAGVDAVVPVLEGRGGHPVLLSPAFIAHLRKLPSDSRLDREIQASAHVVRVAVDDARVRMNLNTPEDWARVIGS